MGTPLPKETADSRERRLAGVRDLRQYDHAFLSVEGADHFGEIFGCKIRTYAAKATPNVMKGLTLSDGAKSARGIDAKDLAIQICDAHGVEYEEKFGRGSQLRSCCDALDQHFSK